MVLELCTKRSLCTKRGALGHLTNVNSNHTIFHKKCFKLDPLTNFIIDSCALREDALWEVLLVACAPW